jgi:hypothetical protein
MASSSPSLHLARDSSYRFAHVTVDDHSAVLWVVILLSIIYAILVFAVRLIYTKWRAHAFDDIVATLAHVSEEGFLVMDPHVTLVWSDQFAACGFRYVGVAIHFAEKRPWEIIRPSRRNGDIKDAAGTQMPQFRDCCEERRT